VITDIIHRFKEPKPAGRDKWMAFCQAHPDGAKQGRQSLSLRIVTDSTEQKILVKCFSGCTAEAAVTAAGLTMPDLFERETAPAFVGKRTVVEAYDYVTVDGELRYQAVRYDPKGFSQRRPDPASPHHNPPAWINDMRGVEPLLYRLNKIQQADKKKRWLCITEGEKDADALAALGLPATTNHGGADQWKDAHTQQAAAIGPDLMVLFEDHDAAGMKRTARIAPAFLAAGITVKVITAAELGGLPAKGDISNWLDADSAHDRDALFDIIKQTRPYVATAAEQSAAPVRWRKGSELDATPITYLAENMIPAGMLGAIGGRDGRGKTLLGLEIARCVLTGAPLFGRFAVKQGNVFAMLLDDPEFLVRARLEQMGILDHPNLRVATRADVDMTSPTKMLAFLAEQLASLEPTFVLIDALYLFVPTGGATDQANSGGAMGPIMSAFDEVANRTRSTVAVVAHDNKAGSDLSGSQVVRNALKWVIRLILPPEFEHDPEGGVETPERILQLNKLKTGKNTSWHLRLDGPGEWAFHGNAREHRKSTLGDRILVYLFDHGHSTTPEIAKDLRARRVEVVGACASLLLAGKVTRGERARADGKPGRGAITYGPLDGPTGDKVHQDISGSIRVHVRGTDRSEAPGQIGQEEGNGTHRSKTQVPEAKEMTLQEKLSVPSSLRQISKGSRGPKLSVPLGPEEANSPGAVDGGLEVPGVDPDTMFGRWRATVGGGQSPA
jgi:hypothetical protein